MRYVGVACDKNYCDMQLIADA